MSTAPSNIMPASSSQMQPVILMIRCSCPVFIQNHPILPFFLLSVNRRSENHRSENQRSKNHRSENHRSENYRSEKRRSKIIDRKIVDLESYSLYTYPPPPSCATSLHIFTTPNGRPSSLTRSFLVGLHHLKPISTDSVALKLFQHSTAIQIGFIYPRRIAVTLPVH